MVEIAREIIRIGNTDVFIKEYKGQRVVTFKDIDMVHERPDGTARKRFNDNKKHFIEGTDFFVINQPSEIRTLGIERPQGGAPEKVTLITESGYLMLVKSFTDDLAWEVQRQLVSGYFRARRFAEDLSPQMQILYGMLDQMAQTEREAKEAKEIAQEAINATNNIKDAAIPVSENWREEINAKFNRIQKNTEIPFHMLRNEMYEALQRRAGCDLWRRLRNKKQRMKDNGCTKTEIRNANPMDIIEEDKRLREIFSKIVMEYEIKYCA